MSPIKRLLVVGVGVVSLAVLSVGARLLWAATPGLPFIEDFTDTALRDDAQTNANWSTDEQALLLAFRKKQFGAFGPGVLGSNITADADTTRAVALGDVDGDGDLDLVAGNAEQNRLYLNNGTSDPWNGVTGSDITFDANETQSVALGDVDGDGDLDLVAGNFGQPNRLYLNNGTATPWAGVLGTDITVDADQTFAVALGDVDGDGDLDLVAGNFGQANRLYLNNGTSDPWNGITGTNITLDANDTVSAALGDVDGDGALDLVAGNFGTNRLYLNNGTSDPWNGVLGTEITPDGDDTRSVALGDVDGDGDLDLVAASPSANRLYLNDGVGDPWDTLLTGTDITPDLNDTQHVALGDVDGDGDLDLVAGNFGQTNRLSLNNGTSDPWNGVTGTDITTDIDKTRSVALGDVDGDGDLDLVAGNLGQANRLYLNNGTAVPWNGVLGSDITLDADQTLSVALGDVDNDGDLDRVEGNGFQPNRLYLNNGTADPWNGVLGTDITADADVTRSVALGDVDGDGDLDLVVGNFFSQPNRLYLNNGTADPWNGVLGTDITADADDTVAVAVGDVDGDGDLDLVAGNTNGQPNRLYLNNGTADPWNGVLGTDITADADSTHSVALADVDGDGDLDFVAGNSNINRLYLNNGTSDPWSGVLGSDITADANFTNAVALGDVDGDGDLDLVAGNGNTNRLYFNNGTSDPWSGVTGSDITADADTTNAVALADVNGDGDLDLVAGNQNQANRLYLNNGTSDPWNGVLGTEIAADANATAAVALGDVDGDGDLDLVAGNQNQANRLYLNNGTADPWNGVTGSNITADADTTNAVALGDVDGDGDLDLVAGNSGANRLYLNDGVGTPWDTVAGVDISLDADNTSSVALGDVDGDGDLDLVAGNTSLQPNRLYLNDGLGDPWDTVAGVDITLDADSTFSVALADVQGDGDLDLVAGNNGTTNRVYLNTGTADPWNGVTGIDITADMNTTFFVALGNVDDDGTLDVVVGNSNQANRFYHRVLFHTAHGRAISLRVDTEINPINNATLTPTATLPPNTGVDYWLSNDGGLRWSLVQPGVPFAYPALGGDLRWRADLNSLSPVLTPRIDQIQITTQFVPFSLGNRVWEDLDGDGLQDLGEPGVVSALVFLFDENGSILNATFTDTNGNYSFGNLIWGNQYSLRFFPPTGFVLSPQDQGVDDAIDSDADPATGDTPVFTLRGIDNHTRWDAGVVPEIPCMPPDEPIFLFQITLTTDGNNFPILHFMDPNQPEQITGYNIYRASDPALITDPSSLFADDIIDMDEATPNKQWVDTSGDPGPFFYEVTAFNHRCPAETAEGPR